MNWRKRDELLGRAVRTADGEKLGKVAYIGQETFVVEKGVFFPKEFTATYDDIREVREGEIFLNFQHADLIPWKDEKHSGWREQENRYSAIDRGVAVHGLGTHLPSDDVAERKKA